MSAPAVPELKTVLRGISNPFRGSIVGDPWKTVNHESDVVRIHQRVFETCLEAVESARSNRGSAGVIINGEPGSGKTHLIGRLRRCLTDDLTDPTLRKPRQAFAYVRLDTNASSLIRHVRRKVVDDLLRRASGPNQFERLVLTRMMEFDNGDGHIALWWEHFRDERIDECRDLLTDICMQESISPAFVEILNHLVAQRHRLDVMSWLRGDAVTPAALDRLGVAPENSDEHPERVAARFLVDLMKLAGTNMPLVICFDQVEALQTAPDDFQALFAFGQLVSQLHDSDNNLVMISCMQSSLYQDIRRTLPVPLLDRLCGYATETLNPLDEELAGMLLSHRLQATEIKTIRPRRASQLWPFQSEDVAAFVGRTGTTPRRLLDQAARRFDELAETAVATRPESMEQEWERRLEESLKEGSVANSVNILRGSLALLAKLTHPNWQMESDPRHDDSLDFILTSPDCEGRVGIRICDNSPVRLAAQLRKLTQLFPQSLGIQKLVLLKDERAAISSNAAKTHQYLKQLELNDAVFHRIAPEAIAALNALKGLLADAKSGDLSFSGSTVQVRTVIQWLREHLPTPLAELSEILTTPVRSGGFEQPVIIERLQELLYERRICRADDAARELNRTVEELLAAAGERTDLFRVLDGGIPVIFSARHGLAGLNDTAKSETNGDAL